MTAEFFVTQLRKLEEAAATDRMHYEFAVRFWRRLSYLLLVVVCALAYRVWS